MVPSTKPRTYFSAQVPTSGTPFRFFLPFTGSRGTSSPASSVIRGCCDFLPSIPPHFVAFVWRYLGCTRSFRSLADKCAAEAWSWSPGISSRDVAEETRRISQVPGESQLSVCTWSPTPAGLLAPDHYSAAAWPLVCEKQRLPRMVFRRSIAWLSDSLSTLRRVRYLPTTQDSLPVAGQALLDGLSTRKVPMKGFKAATYISFPFPKLCLAQSHRSVRPTPN